jgi:quercetin dioxygenase-like cupin family protein
MKNEIEKAGFFGLGKPSEAYAAHFVGQSYLNPVALASGLAVFNVTFAPGCRNDWHVHRASKNGGQIIMCVSGEGWYQEWGKKPVRMVPGDSVVVPPNVKHWHGASKDSWFAHLAIEVPGEDASTEWGEPVSEEEYGKL